MKRTVCAIFLLLTMLSAAGCAGREELMELPSSQQAGLSQTETGSPERSAPDEDMEKAVERYAALYHVEHVYYDIAVPQKMLLIGEEQIVELLCVAGYEQTKVIDRMSVVRVDSSRLGEFDAVNIYDKTNQCISVMVEPGLSEELAALLS